ncbi:MAG: exopolyphosphatase [Cyclobacteriaceae bacterium]|nr:exopolyphosphatase [Cyclobacteriaceae bacterium]
MENLIAIIDLGTNTFHLLIAEQDKKTYRIIHREKQAVKIGAGGINQNTISEAGLQRGIETIKNFRKTIDSFYINKIFAFGTSALRNATNQKEVISKIKQETRMEVSVISGDQEAEFIYWGIQSAMNLGQKKSLIMDIGGGSVEFIIGNEGELFWKRSFEIGGQRLLERFQKNDPIKTEEIYELDTYFESSLPELFTALDLHQPDTLIGSSGTFDTLSEIHCMKGNITRNFDDPEIPLTIKSFYGIYSELITKNRVQRLAIPGMIEMRVDMIVVACCLIRFLLEKHHFRTIRVSSYSLKEGALALLSQDFN